MDRPGSFPHISAGGFTQDLSGETPRDGRVTHSDTLSYSTVSRYSESSWWMVVCYGEGTGMWENRGQAALPTLWHWNRR